jgi:hypothetical protein
MNGQVVSTAESLHTAYSESMVAFQAPFPPCFYTATPQGHLQEGKRP